MWQGRVALGLCASLPRWEISSMSARLEISAQFLRGAHDLTQVKPYNRVASCSSCMFSLEMAGYYEDSTSRFVAPIIEVPLDLFAVKLWLLHGLRCNKKAEPPNCFGQARNRIMMGFA
jgi:hypothetical protein